MQSTSASPLGLLLILVLIPMALLVRKGRNDPLKPYLPAGHRVRPMLLEWFDPALVLVYIGAPLWRELTISGLHVVMAIVGAGIGAVIGQLRARVMYVGAALDTKSVVMKRSGPEYLLVAVVIALRFLEGALRNTHSGPLTLLLTVALGVGVTESAARSVGITLRYRADRAEGRTLTPQTFRFDGATTPPPPPSPTTHSPVLRAQPDPSETTARPDIEISGTQISGAQDGGTNISGHEASGFEHLPPPPE